MSSRERWLNGWGRIGDYSVLIGTGVYCVGCGQDQGITTVAFPPDYKPPERYPDWPFDKDTCPIHKVVERLWKAEDAGHSLYKVQIGASGMPLRSLKGRLPK